MKQDDIYGSLEGQTPLTDHEKLELRPSFSTRGELNEAERLNILSARIWAMRGTVLRRSDLLSDFFGRELHHRMFSQVWGWAGRYRTSERNIGWEWHRIQEGVRVAFEDAVFWLKHETYPLHECAVRLHYQLVVIHPWVNGNGRHARLMADALVASRNEKPLSWGVGANLAATGGARSRYISAIRKADEGNYRHLLRFAMT